MYLLWTERPKLIARELETHDWMLRERPWERFGLTLIHDNAPGDWRHYNEVFRQTWAKARAEGTGMLNVESDVVPTLAAFEAVLKCPEFYCCVPYVIHTVGDGVGGLGYGANHEHRVPGGWVSRLAHEGEEWAVQSDLGFVRFAPGLVQRLTEHEVPVLQADNQCLHEELARVVHRYIPRERAVHLHWPGLRNNHDHWDEGDDAHWTPEQAAELRRQRQLLPDGRPGL